jgi:hypothetical protein
MKRKERRRDPRSNSRVPLDLYDAKGRMIIGEGRFLNVSLTGSMLESRQSLPMRKPIVLQVQGPAKEPLEFAGRVIWRKKKTAKFYYGIRFEPLLTEHPVAGQAPRSLSHAQR